MRQRRLRGSTGRGRPGAYAPAGMAVAALATAVGVLGGCQIGPRNFENVNDQLRAENLQLRRQVDELEERLALRVGELRALRQQYEAATDLPADLADADVPVFAGLALDRYSGAVDLDGDGVDDVIRVYLRPLDQRGRLLPVAGRAHVQAVTIPTEGEPQTLAERTWTPAEFDDAWRSGLTGSHYTLELPLPEALPADLEEVTVKATLTQARTGVTHSVQETMGVAVGE